jgi:hypothetical protein
MDIAELEKQADQAKHELYCIRSEQSQYQVKREHEFRELLCAETAPLFDAKIEAALTVKLEADKRLAEAREAEALTGEGAPYPLGTILYEWVREYRYHDNSPMRLSGRRGILEAVTRESLFPVNMRSYSLPSVGSFIIRLLKKDGTTGKQFENPYKWETWLPEGQKPKASE